jgi:LysM repeat protein
VRKGPVAVGAATAVWIAGPAAQAATHEVRPGETLTGIAHRYGTTVEHLARVNHLSDPNLIVSGQRLRVPGSARVTSVHVVRPGETLAGIAARYGTTVARLVRLNHVHDPNLILAGQHLKVAGAASRSASHDRASPRPSSRAAVGEALRAAAAAVGLDAALVEAVAWQESGWNQAAVSPTGARGVMQVTRATTSYVNEVLGGGDLRRRAMRDNVRIGAMYLRQMTRMFPERKALAAYYTGPGNIHRRLTPGQRHYVNNVEALRARM